MTGDYPQLPELPHQPHPPEEHPSSSPHQIIDIRSDVISAFSGTIHSKITSLNQIASSSIQNAESLVMLNSFAYSALSTLSALINSLSHSSSRDSCVMLISFLASVLFQKIFIIIIILR
ncbi:TPA: hypothetical protein DEG21_00255 [Patescibacteria group bacterium]|nr:hypothetical protein [Candidatus Gracilibacteria bacterium]HBY74358.1 hypothetical protein [Candidatus Gracilibacteria bacterium]